MSTASRPREGVVLDDKWRIAGLIGEGGMGAVYAAAHARNGLSVAIKILSSVMSQDQAIKQRFLSEGYVANRVGHVGSVRVLDDGFTPDGLPYLVMERLVGRTLDSAAQDRGGRLPINDVLRYAIAVADVLASAHAQGIVHRDVKPENIFLCDDGTVKVLDFGIAQVRDLTQQVRITVTGVPLGTPAFMPPEQALAHWHRVGPQSDVYALGATLFSLITGMLVHEATTVPELLVKVATQPARPIQSVLPEVTDALAKVVDRALSYNPEDRYESASWMLAALRGIAAAGPLTTLPSIVSPIAATPAQMPQVEFALKSGGIRETSPAVSSSSQKKPLGAMRTGLVIGAFALLGVGGGVASFVAISKQDDTAKGATTTIQAATPGSATPASSSIEPVVTVEPSASASPSMASSAEAPTSAAPVASGPAAPSASVDARVPSPPSPHSSAQVKVSKPETPAPKPSAGKPPGPTPEAPDPMGFH